MNSKNFPYCTESEVMELCKKYSWTINRSEIKEIGVYLGGKLCLQIVDADGEALAIPFILNDAVKPCVIDCLYDILQIPELRPFHYGRGSVIDAICDYAGVIGIGDKTSGKYIMFEDLFG